MEDLKLITATNYQLAPNRTIVPPTVDDMLDQIGPCPLEALIYGVALDNRPVAVKMNFKQLPFFVSAQNGWGKTRFLKTTLMFAKKMVPIQDRSIACIVFTNRPDEWLDWKDMIRLEALTESKIRSVARAAADCSMGENQYVLILIDGWDDAVLRPTFLQWFIAVMENLKNIVTIITSQSQEIPENVTLIKEGYSPGQFQTTEGSSSIFFFVPSL